MKSAIHALLGPILVLLMHSTAQGEASLRGLPWLQHFRPTDYAAAPRNFDVAVDSAGRIFSANQDGVLYFTGYGWRLLELPDVSVVRQVERGPDDRIYVGGVDRFGVLVDKPEGGVEFHDLRPAFGLDESSRVGIVWQVVAVPGGVWFRAEHGLFFYDTGGNQHRWQDPIDGLRFLGAAGGTLYAWLDGFRVVYADGSDMIEVPGTSALAGQAITGGVAWGDDLLLLTDRGFHRVNAEGVRQLQGGMDAALSSESPTPSMVLPDGSLVISTGSGEMLRYDRELQLLDRIPLGLNIREFTLDTEGGLWAAATTGLMRMRLPSRWTRFGRPHGLVTLISDVEWHDGALWLALDSGLARIAATTQGLPQIERIPEAGREIHSLQSTRAGLLAAGRRGIFVFDDRTRRGQQLDMPQDTVFQLLPSRFRSDTLYARTGNAVWLLRMVDDRWETLEKWTMGDDVILHDMIEREAGELWTNLQYVGLTRLQVDPLTGRLIERRAYGPEQGLDPDEEVRTIFLLDGNLHVANRGRAFVLHDDRFVPDRTALSTLTPDLGQLRVAESEDGAFAWTRENLWHRAHKDEHWQLMRNDEHGAGYGELRIGSDGILRVATSDSELLQYNPGEIDSGVPPQLAVRLVSAELRSPSGERTALPLRDVETAGLRIPAGSNLRLRYGLLTFEPGVKFRYRIEGLGGEWSDWSEVRELPMQTRRPGDYLIHFEARTPTNLDPLPLAFRLVVEPQWHQMLWVRSLGVVILLLLLVMSAVVWLRRRTRRYVVQQQHLERRIAERTADLEHANRKLEDLTVTDALTGVANRRALDQALQREWFRCLDLKRPLSVLMVDVDHFKQYNDSHGHLEGDEALRRVATLLSTGLDPTRELLARYGGEEFSLLLPGVHVDEARRRGDALRSHVAGAMCGLTVSIGIATQVPAPGDAPDRLLGVADDALYRAKRGGRDRVEFAEA